MARFQVEIQAGAHDIQEIIDRLGPDARVVRVREVKKPARTDWPITILRSRYGGVYEGGDWVAFNMYPREIPSEVLGDDMDCMDWFHENRGEVGVGDTPEEAYKSLLES